jgi:DNA-binding PadR family transcriptional regulator
MILGLLAEKPMSGYDIKKHVQATLGSVTNASYGTLYPTLHKLLAEGAVEMREVPQKGRPSKKIYNVTEKGRGDLLTWLNQPPAVDQVRREFLLKLYLAADQHGDLVRTLVDQRLAEMESRLDELHHQRDVAVKRQQEWVADFAVIQCEAEIAWLRRVEAEIDEV